MEEGAWEEENVEPQRQEGASEQHEQEGTMLEDEEQSGQQRARGRQGSPPAISEVQSLLQLRLTQDLPSTAPTGSHNRCFRFELAAEICDCVLPLSLPSFSHLKPEHCSEPDSSKYFRASSRQGPLHTVVQPNPPFPDLPGVGL